MVCYASKDWPNRALIRSLMKFKVQAADKATGAERTFVVDCSSAEEAADRANIEGFLVSNVQPMKDGEALARPVAAQPLEYRSAGATPSTSNAGNVAAGVLGGIIFVGLPVVGGGVLIYYCSQIPCIGFLGVGVGIGLIVAGLMFAGLFTGVVKPEDLPQKPKPRTNTAMVCPHCQSKGTVTTERVKMKKGVSGTKATAAVLTGGVSILATGLSRKEALTRAHCTSCGNTWHF